MHGLSLPHIVIAVSQELRGFPGMWCLTGVNAAQQPLGASTLFHYVPWNTPRSLATVWSLLEAGQEGWLRSLAAWGRATDVQIKWSIQLFQEELYICM